MGHESVVVEREPSEFYCQRSTASHTPLCREALQPASVPTCTDAHTAPSGSATPKLEFQGQTPKIEIVSNLLNSVF